MKRTRRALLFVPGSDAAKIEKAAKVGADSVIVDWEDAAALSKKAEARATTLGALATVDFGTSERVVRVNPIGSGLEHDDFAALASATKPPDAVMLPKVEGGEHVRFAAARLAEIELARGAKLGTIRLIAILETAMGLAFAREIAFADPRLDALAFGAEDYCGDVGATRTAEGHEVAWGKRALVVYAAAARLQALDTPFVDLNDVDRLKSDTRRSMELGYTGRLAIHPKQIEPINAVFTPSADEIAAAKRLVDEHARHQAEGRGVFQLDGKMVDMPMVRAAERVLARARAVGIG
jgi:citrate lyase beta subunit